MDSEKYLTRVLTASDLKTWTLLSVRMKCHILGYTPLVGYNVENCLFVFHF